MLIRYLYLSGRMDLDKTAHECATQLAPVFFPGGVAIPRARITPSWLFQCGVGSAPVAATRALRDLVEARILLVDTEAYLLQPDAGWRWDPQEYQDALNGLRAITDPKHAWSGRPDVAALMVDLVAGRSDITPHPYDRHFIPWFEVGVELASAYGTSALAAAVRAARADPTALVPFDVATFRTVFYALVSRDRRAGVPGR